MKQSIIYTLLSVTLLLASCNQLSKEEQEFDAIMENVIVVHDEVMPKMTELSSLIKNLEPKIDTTAIGKSHAKAQQDLKDSYDFMMEWMRDFSEKFPHTEEKLSAEKIASQMNLLKEEEIEVKKLREQINTSIANAKSLLEK